MNDKSYQEEILKRCKKSLQDVTGWKIFIFLPQNFVWRFFIAMTVTFTFAVATFEFFFGLTLEKYAYVGILCTFLYSFDTIWATFHVCMVKTRKLRHGTKRHFAFLIVDYLSLVPFQLFYNFFVFTTTKNVVAKIIEALRLNVCLRIYQIPFLFFEARYWVYKTKVYFILVFTEVALTLLILNHMLSCLYFCSLAEEVKETCLVDSHKCIIEIELLVLSFLSQSYISIPYIDPIHIASVNALVLYIFGYFLTYGFLLPLLYFASYNYVLGLVNFTTRCEQLLLLLDNLTTNKAVKEKIFDYFRIVWTYGKGNHRPEILKVFPINMQKNIFLDVHWEAFKHSDFFADLSLGCKRSLALSMRTEFVLPNTTLLELNKKKTQFIYLESGLMQIMAQENNTCPVVTFSGGTVLSEMSMFYQLESKAVLRTANFCVIHCIEHENFLKVLLHFSDDMKQIYKRMKYRMAAAKATYARKTKIFPHFVEDLTTISNEKGNIKWIKQQYRAVREVDEIIKKEEKMFENQFPTRNVSNLLHTQMQHTSLYLSLIAINDEVISKYEAVCLRSYLPWFMDPQCHFLKVWNGIIIFLIFVTLIVYPLFMGWTPYVPGWFFSFTIFINLMFTIDIVLPFFTAIRFKNVLITKFGVVLVKRLTSLSLYIDILAALPLQLIIYASSKKEKPYELQLYLFNVFVKSYKLILFLHSWNYTKTNRPAKRTILKNVLLFIVAVYITCMLFKLSGVECKFYNCDSGDWFLFYEEQFDPEQKFRNIASAFMVLIIAFDIPNDFFRTEIFVSYLLYLVCYAFFRLHYFLRIADIVCAFVAEKSHSLNYTKLMELVHYYLRTRRVPGRIPNRVENTMRFQWYYDRGNYITKENRIVDDIPIHLRSEIDKNSLFRTLQLCPLFKVEDEDFLLDMCRISQRIALPANSVLLTFGTQTMCLYVIHKGFVQINSFLLNDTVNNVGWSLVLSSGDVFPVIMAFNQIPSVITARTITDCELIVLNMEDILSAMVVHEVLKDVVEALKGTDLTPLSLARPGISVVGNVENPKPKIRGKTQRFIFLFKRMLYEKYIDSQSKVYLYWEIVRSSCIVCGFLLWPFAYGCFHTPHIIYLVRFLLFLDSTVWIDIYCRLRLSFYNSKGLQITHPFTTAMHYIFTSFILDAVSTLPYIHIIYMLHINDLKYDLTIIIVHMGLRFVLAYKVHGLVNFLTESKRIVHQTLLLEFIALYLVMCNFYVNCEVFNYISRISDTKRDSVALGHIYGKFWMDATTSLLKTEFELKMSVSDLVIIVFFALSAWAVEILSYSFMIINFLGSEKYISDYQYYLKSLMKFLNGEKIEDKYVKEAVNYYEHIWTETKAIDFTSVFSRFPNILHEDMQYSVYNVTLSMVSCLSKANKAFYRTLSRNVEEVHMNKGSIILFEGQVKSDIFFVHKGQCEVLKELTTLGRGSMMGDIRRQGLMKHKIVAKTHVTLLKISSDILFLTMDNFARTKDAYEEEVFKYEDFVMSSEIDVVADDVDEILSQKRSSVNIESEFEPLTMPKKMPVIEQTRKETTKNRMNKYGNSPPRGIIFPGSFISRTFNIIFLLDAFATVFFVPIFISLRSLAPLTLIITYVLDLIWIAKMEMSRRTAIINPKTGIISYNKKTIFRNYFYKIDGFVADLISVLPIEVVPLMLSKTFNWKICLVILYLPRTFRILHIIKFTKKANNRLSANLYLRWVTIVLLILAIINIFSCINIMVHNILNIDAECTWELSKIHYLTLAYSYMCVINCFCGASLPVCDSSTLDMLSLEIVFAVFGCCIKAFLFAQAVSIISSHRYSKFQLIKQLEELENYLVVRNISASLLNRIKVYFINLFDYCNEGGMPFFLKSAPDCIKFHVMGDLYFHHLANCYVFKGVSDTFLTQLSTRLERHIYFPGNYVAKQGDIDHNIYFIHKGEVYCLERDTEYLLLERPIEVYQRNESFGILQGIFPNYQHTKSYRAKTLAEVLILNFEAWQDMRMIHSDATKIIFTNALQAMKTDENYTAYRNRV